MKIKQMRFMTRREWVAKHHPSCIKEKAPGGVLSCPNAYPFSDFDIYRINCDKEDCTKCYDKPAVVNGKYILVRKED